MPKFHQNSPIWEPIVILSRAQVLSPHVRNTYKPWATIIPTLVRDANLALTLRDCTTNLIRSTPMKHPRLIATENIQASPACNRNGTSQPRFPPHFSSSYRREWRPIITIQESLLSVHPPLRYDISPLTRRRFSSGKIRARSSVSSLTCVISTEWGNHSQCDVLQKCR